MRGAHVHQRAEHHLTAAGAAGLPFIQQLLDLLALQAFLAAAEIAGDDRIVHRTGEALAIGLGMLSKVNTAVIAFVNAFPAILLVAIQYSNFFVTGHMMWPNANMHVLWLIGVMVILAVTTVISRKIYRATNNPYLAGIINAVIVTLMSCSNTLTWK